jgi:hypothetical protein
MGNFFSKVKIICRALRIIHLREPTRKNMLEDLVFPGIQTLT